MRELKFRGKRIDNGEWVYGNYFHNFRKGQSHNIVDFNSNEWYEVTPESVGQLTGFYGTYEGDVLKLTCEEGYSNDCVTIDEGAVLTGYISFSNGGWFLNEKDSTWLWLYDLTEIGDFEIIGNMQDNPDLL